MSGAPPQSTDARRGWLALFVVTVAALTYANSLGNDFALDDLIFIRNQPMITGTRSPWGLLTWVNAQGDWYRPLTMLTFAANEHISGAPFGYHLVNLCLLVLITLGVFRLGLLLLDSFPAASVAAVLFATHPIHTEAVSGIVGRAELLAAALVLGAIFAFLRALRATGRAPVLWVLLSVLAFGAACFAKESAVAAIPLMAAIYLWVTPTWRWHRAVALMVPYAAMAAVYVAVRVWLIGHLTMVNPPTILDNPLAHVDTATRLRTAVIVLWQYVSLLSAPMNLAADYSFNEIPLALSFADWRFWLAMATLATIALIVVRACRHLPALAIAAAFLVVPLLLTLNLIFPIGTIKAERLLYFPSIGWCFGLGVLVAYGMQRRRQMATALIVVVVAAFAVRTWVRNEDWKDNATLFAATLEASPGSAKAHHNAGTTLQRAGRLDDAALQYRRALEIYPLYADAAYGIGHIYHLRGLDDGAMHWYLRSLAIDPDLVKAHLQIGLIRLNRGEYDAAEAAFRTGLMVEPDNPELVVNLGAVLLAQGDRWRALRLVHYFDALPPSEAEGMEEARYARRELEVAVQ